jgi:hypothetical protein
MFQNFKEKLLPLVNVSSSMDTDIENGIGKTTWADFVQRLSDFKVSSNKDISMFLPLQAKPQNEWVQKEENLITGKKGSFRNQNNFTHVTMAVLDLDTQGSLEQAQKKFNGIEHVIHSTHSYSPETPYKYRMIMPLENPIPVAQWERTFVHLMAGIEGDYSCKNISRGYYMPSVDPQHNISPVFINNSGKNLTQEVIVNLAEKYMDNKAVSELDKIEGKKDSVKTERLHPSGMQLESKYSGDGLSYEGFLRRHKKKIDFHFDGGKGNRHGYAMDVINSEMGIFEEKTRFDLLIEFIYKSTLENSTSPLSTGNTGDEMPEMIQSGMAIMVAPEFRNDQSFMSSTMEQMKKGLANATQAEKTGNWSFKAVTYEPKVLGNSLKSFKARYFRETEAFEKLSQDYDESGTPDLKKSIMSAFNQKVVTPVIQRELTGNTQFDIQSLGRFFYEMMGDYSIGENPKAAYVGLAKKLSDYISNLDIPAVRDNGLTKELVLDQLMEVTALSPLLKMIENENKQKFRQKNSQNQGTPQP